ncbi:hypothetical protein IT575_11600 [bacterium]|nr:hypothetical protein [bacterium]
MQFLRRQLPVIIAFVVGLSMWVLFYVPTQKSLELQDGFTLWVRIIVGFAAVLGVLSVVNHHYNKIKAKRPGYAFSFITLGAFLLMALSGFIKAPLPGFAAGNNKPDSLHFWLYNNMMLPMQATMFSILAFFIASAAFRAFRARSMEATVLLVAACVTMLGRVPLGELMKLGDPIFLGGPAPIDFPWWSSWLLNVPNSAAQRGILLGVYLSQIAVAIRIIFGIERTYMGGGD